MVPTITEKKAKALRILREKPGITAREFAVRYFDAPENEILFTAVSNQGNGACAGKKAWLCAGSLLGKLYRQGLVWKNLYSNPSVFALSEIGWKALDAYENNDKDGDYE